VPTYRSVTVYFDPLKIDWPALEQRLNEEAAKPRDIAPSPAPVQIPVCYGGEFGPDLDDVAEFAHVGTDDVIGLHTAAAYRVFMLGFLPGFPYMGVVPERIAAPRRSTPRRVVPAGSVGIAGPQTGVYPLASPGGWQLIGRTPLRLFDTERTNPFLVGAGDAVQFFAISADEYERWPSA